MNTLKKVLKWTGVGFGSAFIFLVIVRFPYVLEKEKTTELVAKIHATKLSMEDVAGDFLPPDPSAEANRTIAGIDANKNGIRDDVELAIFKEYPDSTKTRAVLLQYALALQMEAIQPVVNMETVTEVATEESRADTCVADTLVPRETPESFRSYEDVEKINTFIRFVEERQFNTSARKRAHHDFYQGKLGSYGESTNVICDVDFSVLPN